MKLNRIFLFAARVVLMLPAGTWRKSLMLWLGSAALAGFFITGASAQTAIVIFSDDFESGTMSRWTTTATSPLDPSTVNNIVPPSPVGHWSAYMNTSLDRMHRNLIADNGGAEVVGPAVATWWIYDPGSASLATRIFCEVRGYSGGSGLPNGGTTASGSLLQLFAAGKYNTVTLPGEVFSGTKYQARANFSSNTASIVWFNLNGAGSPNRSTGWHRFDVERMSDGTTVNFYVDGIISRTVTGTVPEPWDTLILGPGLGSTVGDAWIDGMAVERPDTQPPVLNCPTNLTTTATGSTGATASYTVTATDNSGANVTITCNPPSGSTFPVGTSTVSCTACDASSNCSSCSFAVTVTQPNAPERYSATANLPPPGGMYVSPQLFHVLAAQGIIISNISHRRFTQSQPPPPAGGAPQIHAFGSTLNMDVSVDGGQTFIPVSALAAVQVRVTPTTVVVGGSNAPVSTYDTEMLQLDVSGGGLPPGVMIRESPTRASTGRTTSREVPGGGYMIGSFFDIFTEISTDGGATWQPAAQAAHLELRGDPTAVTPIVAPSRLLPPPNDLYVSPKLFHILLQNGIVIRDIKHRYFTQSLPPPLPGGPSQLHHFDSQLDMQVSFDGGATYQPVRAPGAVDVQVTPRGMLDGAAVYDTEMLAFNVQGGGLPAGVMLRESPTRRSEGGVAVTATTNGTQRIGSFFDIWLEASTDGGANWTPADGAGRVELDCKAPEVPKPSPNLPPPDGQYVSPADYHAAYAAGIIIKNATHDRFTQSQPPPPPGGSQVQEFDSQVHFQLSMDNGATFSPASAPAHVRVLVRSSVDDPASNTRFFDTEMLQLDISGGSLPASVRLRESPTKQSLGRTSIRRVNDPATGIWDYISSSFDIFTELSADGGANWQPAFNGPTPMVLGVPCLVLMACPADLTTYSWSAAGKVVTFSPSVGPVDTCNAPVTSVVCNPPSGSTFPVGATTVTCMASSTNASTTCSFTVTVKRLVLVPHWFPHALLPPPNGEYVSPTTWHQLYANGIIISNVSHRRFLQSFPVPSPLPGVSETHTFGSEVAGEMSADGGLTFSHFAGNADVTVRLNYAGSNPDGTQNYDTEMLSLALIAPGGIIVRESPTRASTGRTTVQSLPGGGYAIGSFFDVFTEISTDGGASWSPAHEAAPMALQADAQRVTPIATPTRLLPPPVDLYASPQLYPILLQNGIVIRNMRYRLFTSSILPPEPGVKATHIFGSQVDLELSTDGGITFRAIRAPAQVSVGLEHRSTELGTMTYNTEMLQMDAQGGDLPNGLRLRESPTLASHGGTAIAATAAGQYRIGSFFDIFVELSTDGGVSWIPAPGPAHLELICEAPPIPLPDPNLPPFQGQYISPQQWHAYFAAGVIISNVSHKRFTETFPPPPPGVQDSHTFGSQVECDLSLNNGGSWQHVSLPAQVTVSLRELTSDGNTRFFETEMLQLDITGPNGIRFRESPTKQSLGRTSIRTVNDPASGNWDYMASFFGIFLELSTDGGVSWQTALNGPGTVTLVALPSTPIHLTSPVRLTNGAFQFAFSNSAGGLFNVLATTNLSLPLNNWTVLGPALEGPAGQYQFSDSGAATNRQRFYKVRSP